MLLVLLLCWFLLTLYLCVGRPSTSHYLSSTTPSAFLEKGNRISDIKVFNPENSEYKLHVYSPIFGKHSLTVGVPVVPNSVVSLATKDPQVLIKIVLI